MNRIITFFSIFVTAICSNAQIGYQISILDNSTGEPRVNEKVSVGIDITDSTDKVIYHSVKSGTTDQFGVLSLTIGDAETFSQVDWSQLPLYISAKLDGVLIGKSQILSVPVAEYAKKTGVLTMEKLCGKTWSSYNTVMKATETFEFQPNGLVIWSSCFSWGETKSNNYTFTIDGNYINILSPKSCDNEDLTGNVKNLTVMYYDHYTNELYFRQ